MQRDSFKNIINSGKPVLIDFYADWCGPCKVQAPVLKKLKAMLGNSTRVIKIDVDKNKAIASKLKVLSIPTVMIFHRGKLIWRASGVQSLGALKKKLMDLVS